MCNIYFVYTFKKYIKRLLEIVSVIIVNLHYAQYDDITKFHARYALLLILIHAFK